MAQLVVSVVLAVAMAGALAAQCSEPAFDAVSIKRNTSGARSASLGAQPGMAFSMTNLAMLAAVTYAYPARNEEVIGAPDWLRNDRYDIVAKASGKPTEDQVRTMLRTMLKERLALAAHIESREIPVFAMVVSRPGHPGLKPFTQDCDAIRAARDEAAKSGSRPAPPAIGTALPCGYSWATSIVSGGITMDTLASEIGGLAGRVVLDRTGLAGRYEFTLRAGFPNTAAPSPDDPPSIFTALPEQLGLRLDAQRANVDTLIIEHVEPPKEN